MAGLLLLLGMPVCAMAARPWPDTRERIVPFADLLPGDLTAAPRRFAAMHLAGTQKMRRSEIRALRAYNPNFLCLHYQLAVGAGPAHFILGDAWGSDWAHLNAQEDWFLHNASGQRIHQAQWNWDVMDIRYVGGRPVTGFPSYWIHTCLERIRAAESDGVFADSYLPDAYGFGQSRPAHPWLEDPALCMARWVPGLEQFGREARAALAAQGYRFLPNLGGLITGWLDVDYGLGHGGMIECFALWGPGSYFDPADWALQMDRALALVRSNKIVICQSYPSGRSLRERMFATASYLLIKGRATYLNLLATDDVALEYYPEYTVGLGWARGAFPAGVEALWRAEWGVYRRDYSNGIVLVNPGENAVTIPDLGKTRWLVVARGGGRVGEDGRAGGSLVSEAVRRLTLPAHSGAVLMNTSAPPGGDAFEPDDTASAARRIGNGETQVRSIHVPGNTDWAKIRIGSSGVREVVLETSGASEDTQMWLYRGEGTLVAYNDNGGRGNFSRIRLATLAPRTYYIKIREHGNNGTIPLYILKAEWTEP